MHPEKIQGPGRTKGLKKNQKTKHQKESKQRKEKEREKKTKKILSDWFFIKNPYTEIQKMRIFFSWILMCYCSFFRGWWAAVKRGSRRECSVTGKSQEHFAKVTIDREQEELMFNHHLYWQLKCSSVSPHPEDLLPCHMGLDKISKHSLGRNPILVHWSGTCRMNKQLVPFASSDINLQCWKDTSSYLEIGIRRQQNKFLLI